MSFLLMLLMPVIALGVLAALIAVPVVSVRLTRAWEGLWRVLAAIPAAAFAFVLVRLIIDTSIDPTSHNLWPFEFAYVAAPSVAWLALLVVLRRAGGGSVPPLLAWRMPGGARREWTPKLDWRAVLDSPSPRLRTGAGILGAWLMLQGLAALSSGGSRGAAGAMVVATALLWTAIAGRWPGWFRRGR